jgi:acetyl/propionyl-CoA carboxylase alpha subunit
LWERECSIQRRYQKVVEVAVSTVGDRRVVGRVIEAAVRMAERVSCFLVLFGCCFRVLTSLQDSV